MPAATISQIPELLAVDSRESLIRIPQELDVPVTARVRRLIDTPAFRRLARISQLGLVSLVYPGAYHTRFEHSLGVYRMALLYLKRLAHDRQFCELISPPDAELFLVTALLHDLGHWPFCHPIEDIRLEGVPQHEQLARDFLHTEPIATALIEDWKIHPKQICDLLARSPHDPKSRLICTLLSGPIDVDKMDYLYRDSLHAGVPYGRNFDNARLIGSLTLNQAGDGLAITDKGKTAAEMMVFSRYVMFSEVYWHHAVRAATVMLQTAFALIYPELDLTRLLQMTEQPMIDAMTEAARGTPAERLLEGLFGCRRSLYKRVAQFSYIEDPEMYERVARRPHAWLVQCSHNFGQLLSQHLDRPLAPLDLLIDAPPVKLEVDVQLEVFNPKTAKYQQLADVSPVVETLAHQQFDKHVKRVRVFASPELAATLPDNLPAAELLMKACDKTEATA